MTSFRGIAAASLVVIGIAALAVSGRDATTPPGPAPEQRDIFGRDVDLKSLVDGPANAGRLPVTVAVIDSGVAQAATDGVRVRQWRCLPTCEAERPRATTQHGSQVASTVLNAANRTTDGPNPIGNAVRLLSYRIVDDTGRIRIGGAARALTQARERGADIAVMSTVSFTSRKSLHRAVTDFGPGLIVTAAGNRSGNIDNGVPATYPCALPDPHILCVTTARTDGGLAREAATGPVSVDIAAPGTGLAASNSHGRRVFVSGSSYATAVTAGAAALVMLAEPGVTPLQGAGALVTAAAAHPSLTGATRSGGHLQIREAIAVAARLRKS